MKVTEIVTIEPCRDGGTLIAQFKDENEVHYCLELRVILVNSGKNSKLKGIKTCVNNLYA